ncbi:hypothetical protein QGM71_14190 [Virgibacillus sp. C22-A2]|uniref:Uncharacterized protein n=1 Tax=Virgibacillus tibetensis TaxID=3042313 RepID=A0ABU6KHT3_9BACI|nr:hypothetical protein [Virgibacillus sp. C22-A2]
MTKENLNGNLNEISKSLINMHVSDLLNKYNISKESNKLRKLSNTEKTELADSVRNLQTQAEAFLNDTRNKNGKIIAPTPESLRRRFDKIQRNKK